MPRWPRRPGPFSNSTNGWTGRGPRPASDRFPNRTATSGLKTFFTELAQRPALCADLWPSRDANQFGETPAELSRWLLEREQRRLLLSSAIRLGHPMIDLWLAYTRLTGTLAPGRSEEAEPREDPPPGSDVPLDEQLAREFVEVLDRQRQSAERFSGPVSYAELHRLATDFSLLADVNFHEMRERPLKDLPGYFADQIGQQQPIAGMYGGVSPRTVRQFRMPGYPYVLVTTDVLQEGEDLHTFCDRIVHYGISWTPSAIEQRIGRVDRIGSLVQRRLEGEHQAPAEIKDDDYLQVYFPYLRDTYEYVQMGVVFERLNRFLEMLHDLRLPRTGQASELDVSRQIHERADSVFQPYREPLKSGFPIPEELMPEGPAEPAVQLENSRLLKYFDELATGLAARFRIEWSSANHAEHQRQGIAFVQDGRLLAADEDPDRAGVRQQPFSLGLRTTHGGRLLLRCTSPLGTVYQEQFAEVMRLQRAKPHLKICANMGDADDSYYLAVQTDLLFSRETTQPEELEHVFGKTLVGADEMERELFAGKDHTAAELGVVGEEDAKHGPD